MEWLSTWWGGLDIFSQILHCISIPSTLILIIQTILIIAGFGDSGPDTNLSDTSGLDLPDGGVDFDGGTDLRESTATFRGTTLEILRTRALCTCSRFRELSPSSAFSRGRRYLHIWERTVFCFLCLSDLFSAREQCSELRRSFRLRQSSRRMAT